MIEGGRCYQITQIDGLKKNLCLSFRVIPAWTISFRCMFENYHENDNDYEVSDKKLLMGTNRLRTDMCILYGDKAAEMS